MAHVVYVMDDQAFSYSYGMLAGMYCKISCQKLSHSTPFLLLISYPFVVIISIVVVGCMRKGITLQTVEEEMHYNFETLH